MGMGLKLPTFIKPIGGKMGLPCSDIPKKV